LISQEYQKLEDEYQQVKAHYKYLSENGGDKKVVKVLGKKLYKMALKQVTLLQHIELEEKQ